jgi:hypothetical protein
MDSQEIKVCGLIKDLKVSLVIYLDISILMNVIVIDVPYAWGMLLSRKRAAGLGGSIHMDLSYATIATCMWTFVNLHREPMSRYHVQNPNDPMNELLCNDDEFGNFDSSKLIGPRRKKIFKQKE